MTDQTKTTRKRRKPITVSSSTAKTIVKYLIANGLAKNTIEATLEQSIDELEAADSRLQVEVYQNLWDLALSHTGNPALGLELGAEAHIDEMGLVGHIFFNNATLGDALKQYERFYSLINEGMHLEQSIKDDCVYLQFVCDDETAYCLPDIDRTLAIAIHRARENISKGLAIEYVGFQHDAPSYAARYNEIFPCEVRFAQPHTLIVFKARYLDFKLPNRSSYLHKILNHHIENLFKKIRPEPSLTNKVKSLVERKLSKDSVDAAHIADKLHMSRHTLYRKLKQEGMAFHDVVDQVREQKAREYLHANQHSLSEIAFLLGFSELSAFSRAFKRWTGESPAKYISKHVKK